MIVPTTLTTTEIAGRIQRAYLRLCPTVLNTSRCLGTIWEGAALALIELNRKDRRWPLDPELFVYSQLDAITPENPWFALVHPGAAARYRRNVRRIVARLKAELGRELRRIERGRGIGLDLESVFREGGTRLSALGRYIAARREQRDDLVELVRDACAEQHAACPLYKAAFCAFLPEEDYPVPMALITDEAVLPPPIRWTADHHFSLN